MTNKNVIASLILAALSSFQVLAIENGTSVDWQNDFDDQVKNNCTGMIVGGNQVLTAAHCTDLTSITFADGTVMDAVSGDDHPSYLYSSSGSQYDVSVWTLPQDAKAQNIHYFADLNASNIHVSDSIEIYGFGGDNPLSYAVASIDKLPINTTYQYTTSSGLPIQGDSGGMILKNNKVFAIHVASSHGNLRFGTDLHQTKDFILEKINGWHYPTVLKGTGTQTIKVQSLHQNAVVDAAYVAGDVTITGGTCQTLPTINAFETCTYELNVTGTGQFHLTTDEVININPTKTPTQPTPNPSHGSSGGSLNFWGLFALIILILKRK